MWPQHIIHRGNNRQPTFFADEGYQLYLECSADAAKHQACDIHAYVLMTNPVHLLVTPRQPQGVSKLVLSCYRYIELNPVRAAIVKDPMEYRWSSYPRNA